MQAFHARDDLTQFCREAPPEFTNLQRDVFCVFSGEGVSKLRTYLNSEAERTQLDGANDMEDDDEISVEDEDEHGGMVILGDHAPTVPVIVVDQNGQPVQTMYQHQIAEAEEDEEGIDGDDEQEGDVHAMTGSMQLTGIADPMPVDAPAPPLSPQQTESAMDHTFQQ